MVMNDAFYMQRALDLARRGLGRTWPNPMVGAVVVRAGKIVGEGWHRRCGGPHAEVHALKQAGRLAMGATLYVTLEPCSHFGKTPPCAPAVAEAGVRRVVAAMRDPNPKVCGRGLALLRKAGVQVETGLMQREARELNKVFIKRVTTGLPYVVCKAALSMDGKIACHNKVSRWITGVPARRYAHGLRVLAAAILVGAGTVLQDDPELNVRLAKPLSGRQPIRVILAGERTLPSSLKIFHGGQRTILVTSRQLLGPVKHTAPLEIWHFPKGDIRGLLQRLASLGVSMLLVEGGSEIHASFLGLSGLGGEVWADELQFIYAPLVIGGRQAAGPVGGRGADKPLAGVAVKNVVWRCLGSDWLMTGTPVAGCTENPERL